MPPKLQWMFVARAYPAQDATMLIESMKPSKITKSDLVTCNVCNVPAPHKMRVRERRCRDKACKEVTAGAKCDWRSKTLECQTVNLVSIAEIGAHLTPRRAVQRVRLTAAMTDFATDLAAQGLKPSRSRNGMMTRFALDQNSLPSLQRVQRFVNYYTRSQLRNNDFIDEAKKDIWDAGFTGSEADDAAFTFSWRLNTDGKRRVGRGTDMDPFLVGISTKNLLRKADREPSTFVMHMDATFKLSQAWYPAFVVGLSDSNRTFHVLAIFISSQRMEEHFTEALQALRRVYAQFVERPLKISYSMGDTNDAQWNAFQNVFGADNTFAPLMCFFHVTAKVFERTRHLPTEIGHAGMRGLQNIHFTRCESEYSVTKEEVVSEWRLKPELATFVKYFKKQWVTGKLEN